MGWLNVAYRVTLGSPERNKKLAEKTKAVGLKAGSKMVSMAGAYLKPENQPQIVEKHLEQIGALALAPEVNPEIAPLTDGLAEAA